MSPESQNTQTDPAATPAAPAEPKKKKAASKAVKKKQAQPKASPASGATGATAKKKPKAVTTARKQSPSDTVHPEDPSAKTADKAGTVTKAQETMDPVPQEESTTKAVPKEQAQDPAAPAAKEAKAATEDSPKGEQAEKEQKAVPKEQAQDPAAPAAKAATKDSPKGEQAGKEQKAVPKAQAQDPAAPAAKEAKAATEDSAKGEQAGNEQVDELIQQVTAKVTDALDFIFQDTVRQEVSTALSQALTKAFNEGDFFRQVNADMRKGLEAIYKEIGSAKDPAACAYPPEDTQESNQLLNEASSQLDEILKSTEDATTEVMNIVEKHQGMVIHSGQLLNKFRAGEVSKQAVNQLLRLNDMQQRELMKIMTAMSFQDLTGQRIKKIVSALKRIEDLVFNMYMSSGLAERVREEGPERDVEEIKREAQERVEDLKKGKVVGSELKGPQSAGEAITQDAVDDLLAQLGL